jgi:toxin-antitoxin system PIN domain toxin
MTACLLDVNLLLALAWPTHMHHRAAHRWFGINRKRGWATCQLTQAGFVRISALPRVTKNLVTIADATAILAASTSAAEHVFWGQTAPLTEMLPELRARIMGPQQLTDALLLDLAVRNGGTLATLDRRVCHLIGREFAIGKHLETIPTE